MTPNGASQLDTIVQNVRVVTASTFQRDFGALIAHSDTLKFLRTVPPETAQLVVSSPPYNIGKSYEQKAELSDYLACQTEVLRECVRVLKPNGSLCWEVGNHVDGGEIYPLDVLFYQIIKQELGLKLRNRIIWSFEHGLHASKRFSGRYEVVLWFTKGDDFVFNLDPVRVPQKYPGKRYFKGARRGQISGNPLGKNPGDLWQLMADEWLAGIWDIPNVKNNHPEKTIHPAQFPIELIERLVLALTNEDDIVLDPFAGVGSSLIAAVLHGRRAIGVDYSETYTKVTEARVSSLLSGTLKRRPLGKPKYQPTGHERVAQRPQIWDEPLFTVEETP